MKLRLRSLESKLTHKIQIPDSSSLQLLKLTLIQTLFPNSNQNQISSLIENLRFSLNRKDEIRSDSSTDGTINTLQSLGITNGDLIFFTFNHFGFNSSFQDSIFTHSGVQSALVMENGTQITPGSSTTSRIRDAQKGEIVEKGTHTTPESSVCLQIRDSQKEEIMEKGTESTPESSLLPPIRDAQKDEIVEKDQNLVVDADDRMEVDADDVDEDGEGSVDADVGSVAKSFSVPGFLRKVFSEELCNESGRDHKLLVIAIHAVLLDSGLVAYDVVGRKEINGFPFRDGWPLGLFNLRLFYTLPGIMSYSSDSADSISSVCLKFHSLGNSVAVYGSVVSGNKSAVYTATFDEGWLVPFLNVVWANCGLNDEISFGGQGSGTNAEKEVFEFWRRVKDGLALPMLIDLSEKFGLGLPPCFMRLPTEIKLKILESLPGVDVARAGCACSELRYLCSSDELWKKKYAEQFGDATESGYEGHWKSKFARHWETNRKRRRVVGRFSVGRMPLPRMPSIIGGHHDILPLIVREHDDLRLPHGGVLPIGRHHQSSLVPGCHLGLSGQW